MPQDTLAFATPDIAIEHRADGLILRSRQPLEATARCVGVYLAHWAEAAPDRVFLAERDAAGGWRRLDYCAAHAGARAIGQALLDRGL